MTTHSTLRIEVPSPEEVHDLGDGYHAVPVLFDDDQWASFPPCHSARAIVVLPVSELAASGESALTCPTCSRPWAVIWDSSDASGRGYALWIG